MSKPLSSREVRLSRRPARMPEAEDFDLAEVTVAAPEEGQIRVRNVCMSVDPYMRGRMRALKSYIEPFALDEPLEGDAVGIVIDSRHPDFSPGDTVRSNLGWREAWTADAGVATRVDPELAPLPAYLGVMGLTGLTAYVGLLDIAGVKEGETVFVSGAAGAVGSVVCQIARLKGCRVIGSAGSPEKTAWLKELGVDEAIDYKRVDRLSAAVADAAPDGIDVYFDNVGGDHLEVALQHMNDFGRIAACGMISVYNDRVPPAGPRNLINIVAKRLQVRGFIAFDHLDRSEDFMRDMSRWLAEGRVHSRQTVVEGIERAPEAFIGLFSGENIGKMVVRLAEEKTVQDRVLQGRG